MESKFLSSITSSVSMATSGLCGHCVALCTTEAITHYKLDMGNFTDLDKQQAGYEFKGLKSFLRSRRHRLAPGDDIRLDHGRDFEDGGRAQKVGMEVSFHRAPAVILFYSPAIARTPKDDCVIPCTAVSHAARTLCQEATYISLFEFVANPYPPIVPEPGFPPGHKVMIQHHNALHLPLDDLSVDAASMQHVGLNMQDKADLWHEFRRVLRPEGKLVLYEMLAGREPADYFPAGPCDPNTPTDTDVDSICLLHSEQ